jgi:branched-chain amino acid transport system permease protein
MSFSAWLELLASGLITGGIYALVALGLNLQYGLMRILNIAHGEFLMVGAYLTWMAQTSLGLNPLLMVPVSFGMLFVLGWVIHRLCFRRLTVTSPNLDIFEARGLMVAFGLMFLVQNFASWMWGGDLRGYDFLTEPVQIPLPGGGAVRGQQAAGVCLALLFSGALIVLLRTTLLGKGVRALMQSPTGAQLMGINTQRLHPLMFGIGLGLSGVAGCAAVHGLHHQPVHGRALHRHRAHRHHAGRLRQHGRCLAGGLLLGVIEALGMHFTNPSLKALLSYVVFISVLLLRPEGLFTARAANHE